MNWISLIAIYFVTWWLCLFAILPIGVTSHSEVQSEDTANGSWTEPGAPVRPRLVLKMALTSVLAAIVVALVYWLLSNPVIQEYWS